ncbi:MAG: DsbA family protein [Candidatus Dormibacteria bacterium]
MGERIHVDIRVDPACPWAWLAFQWLAEVARVRDVQVRARLFSLFQINRTREAELKAGHEAAVGSLRTLVAARRAGGDVALARLYTELGEAIHERGEEPGGASLRRALRNAHLDPRLAAEALEDDSTLQELMAEHDEARERGIFGVPTVEVDGSAPFFGPVVDRPLTGREAGELWDHVVWALEQPYLFELKRSRTSQPQIGRLLRETA